jgi:predicted RNA binding protein YcfA (HicA-like mRNA interferase family)
MTGKEMLKLLTKHGWQVVRINGSHHVLTKPGNPNSIPVPVHGGKPLAIGTEKSILRKAGLK